MPTLILFAIFFLIIVLLFFEFVRNDITFFDAFVHDEVLVSFGTLELERTFPGVATNVGELSGHLQDLEVVHESKGKLGLFSAFLDDGESFIVTEQAQSLLLAQASESTLRFDVGNHRLELIIYRFDHVLGMDKGITNKPASYCIVNSFILIEFAQTMGDIQATEGGLIVYVTDSSHSLDQSIEDFGSIVAD